MPSKTMKSIKKYLCCCLCDTEMGAEYEIPEEYEPAIPPRSPPAYEEGQNLSVCQHPASEQVDSIVEQNDFNPRFSSTKVDEHTELHANETQGPSTIPDSSGFDTENIPSFPGKQNAPQNVSQRLLENMVNLFNRVDEDVPGLDPHIFDSIRQKEDKEDEPEASIHVDRLSFASNDSDIMIIEKEVKLLQPESLKSLDQNSTPNIDAEQKEIPRGQEESNNSLNETIPLEGSQYISAAEMIPSVEEDRRSAQVKFLSSFSVRFSPPSKR